MPKANSRTFICPVCGFPDLTEPPYDQHGCASFDICPCCGTEFGYTDARKSHDQLRDEWLAAGAHWHSRAVQQPPGWNALNQLRAAGLK